MNTQEEWRRFAEQQERQAAAMQQALDLPPELRAELLEGIRELCRAALHLRQQQVALRQYQGPAVAADCDTAWGRVHDTYSWLCDLLKHHPGASLASADYIRLYEAMQARRDATR